MGRPSIGGVLGPWRRQRRRLPLVVSESTRLKCEGRSWPLAKTRPSSAQTQMLMLG